MPITGDRADFTETLVENLSQHPWAHLPVTLQLEARDRAGQVGRSAIKEMTLPARRFFDPMAATVIEQRRDLLWAKANARRVTQVLRAVSHQPSPDLFRSETAYLRLRVILRRLETLVAHDSLTDEAQGEIAQALWDLAIKLEEGDIGDALERMRAARERLSEAMKNGASQEEIARLMQELRRATEDYLRQKSRQAQREGQQDGDQQMDENMRRMTQQDLQDMMDRIQELMEQGRMAEAQQALEEFQRMMENMRVTQGQGQQGQSPGQQAMEGLADTLRQQQGLSDQAFRDLQEQFNPNAEAGQSQGNEGRSGGQGQARGQAGAQQSDPLGRSPGQGGRVGTQDSLLQGEDVYRRARELLDEIRRRAGEGERPDVELDYLERLLDRF
jgi:uncharacterized protein (TIGR02302 family)